MLEVEAEGYTAPYCPGICRTSVCKELLSDLLRTDVAHVGSIWRRESKLWKAGSVDPEQCGREKGKLEMNIPV